VLDGRLRLPRRRDLSAGRSGRRARPDGVRRQHRQDRAAERDASVRIGCSGWLYKHWRGDFYPKGPAQKDELDFYTERFDTAEINASFYRMPGETAPASWRARTPEGFLFAWKAWRFITHLKRLKDPEEPVAFMIGRAEGLGPKLGPLLYQMPPGMKMDRERLAAFLKVLPGGFGTPSSSATRAGTSRRSSTCSASTTPRWCCRTTTTPPRLGRPPPAGSTCAGTGRRAVLGRLFRRNAGRLGGSDRGMAGGGQDGVLLFR
jgi:hypothetical protein